ncbi:MAG: cholesterol esterase [Streptomyces sp.]|nr:cholesterol esterase [Streptomyces sp.]
MTSFPEPGARPEGHTRWSRLAWVMVPTVVVSALLLVGIGSGILPVSLAVTAQSMTISGQNLKISADRLVGTGFTQYVSTDRSKSTTYPEAIAGIDSADLYNLCQSMVVKLPVVGETTLRIGAGGGGKPAHADHLVVHTDDLGGDAEFHNIVIGQDASTFKDGSGDLAGLFGQSADNVRIDHLRQSTREVTAATFRLTGLRLSVKAGDKPCY